MSLVDSPRHRREFLAEIDETIRQLDNIMKHPTDVSEDAWWVVSRFDLSLFQSDWEIDQVFRRLDRDGNGVLDRGEFETGWLMIGVPWIGAHDFFDAADTDHDGVLSIDEFRLAIHNGKLAHKRRVKRRNSTGSIRPRVSRRKSIAATVARLAQPKQDKTPLRQRRASFSRQALMFTNMLRSPSIVSNTPVKKRRSSICTGSVKSLRRSSISKTSSVRSLPTDRSVDAGDNSPSTPNDTSHVSNLAFVATEVSCHHLQAVLDERVNVMTVVDEGEVEEAKIGAEAKKSQAKQAKMPPQNSLFGDWFHLKRHTAKNTASRPSRRRRSQSMSLPRS